MKNLTAHIQGGWLIVCLLLALACLVQAQCPAYPRAMDQVYICNDASFRVFDFDQKATIHNPTRFTFPVFGGTAWMDFKNGAGWQTFLVDGSPQKCFHFV